MTWQEYMKLNDIERKDIKDSYEKSINKKLKRIDEMFYKNSLENKKYEIAILSTSLNDFIRDEIEVINGEWKIKEENL